MEKLLGKISQIFKDNNSNELSGASQEKKFLFLYSLFHYYYGDEDYLLDVCDHCKYTLENGNAAQAIFEEDTFDETVYDILVPYYVENDSDFQDRIAKYKADNVSQMLDNIANNIFDAVSLHHVILDYWDGKVGDAKFIIRVITNYNPDYDTRMRIKEMFERIPPRFKGVSFEIVFGDEILNDITSVSTEKPCVEIGKLILDKPNAYIEYGDEKSLITNIKATSLKENYTKYKHSGLFALNLRFYIADKKVDPEIEKTIKEKPENFWYLNNGIIIVCDDYRVNGDELELKNFSIVNGGQTTRMIGEIPFTKDFTIFCKVIKNKQNKESVEYAEFISDIAQASNNQKPIKSEDLIANRKEQRLLKTRLASAGIFVSIKRGDATAANLKTNYPETWMRSKNTEIAQMLYSFIYQKPGTARNSKDSLFSNPKKYNVIFKDKEYSLELMKDLLITRSYYKKWLAKIAKDPNSSSDKVGLCKNGILHFIAALGLLSKFIYSKDLVTHVNSLGFNSDAGDKLSSSWIFNHRVYNDSYDALEQRIFTLFEYIYDKFILPGYAAAKRQKIDLIYSNFLKTDAYYKFNVASNVFEELSIDGSISQRLQSVIRPLFYEETENDKNVTKDLLEKALNSEDEIEEEVEDEDPISKTLKTKLQQYREATFKATPGMKAYEVFTNKELDKIVEVKPKSTFQLQQFGCFSKQPRSKVRLYGEEIVAIVKSVLGE